MFTVTLSVFDCVNLGSDIIRDAIQELPGEEHVEVEVYGGEDDEVVVKHVNGSASLLVTQIYRKLTVRASVLNVEGEDEDEEDEDSEQDDEEEEDDDGEEEDDDGEDDDGDGDGEEDDDDGEDDNEDDDGDDEDEEDEAEDDDDTYLQMSSLSLYGTGLPATAIPEPSWEDQPVADPTRIYFYNL